MEYPCTSLKPYNVAPSRVSSSNEYGANWSWIPILVVVLVALAILAVTMYMAWIFCERRRIPRYPITNGQDPNTPENIQYGSGFGGCNIV